MVEQLECKTEIATFTCDGEDELQHCPDIDDYDCDNDESAGVARVDFDEFEKMYRHSISKGREELEKIVEQAVEAKVDYFAIMELVASKREELGVGIYESMQIVTMKVPVRFIEQGNPNRYQLEKTLRSFIFSDITQYLPDIRVDLPEMSSDEVSVGRVMSLFSSKQEADNYKHYRVIKCPIKYKPYIQRLVIPLVDKTFAMNCWSPPQWLKRNFYLNENVTRVNELTEIHSLFFTHLTNGDLASCKFLIKWIAYSLRGRNPTMLLTVGETRGIGKTILFEILMRLHGEENSAKVRDHFLKTHFNSAVENVTLLYLDEVFMDSKSRDQINRLKDLVNDTLEVERKGKDARKIKNYANVYMSSNDYNGIAIENDDRRFSLIELTDIPFIDTPLRDRYDELFTEENIAQLGFYLMSLDVKREDVARPFVSITTKKVREATKPEWEKKFIEWIELKIQLQQKRVEKVEFDNYFKSQYMNMQPPGRVKFEKLEKVYPGLFRLKKAQGSDGYFFELGTNTHQGMLN